MGCSDVLIPVFIETNLGTRLVVPVFPNTAANEFKRELERKHLNCFPEIGSIRVNALTVKRKSCCYHLSESLPLKYAFLGSNGTWFLQVDVDNLDSAHKKRMKQRTRKKAKILYLKAAVFKIPAVVCLLKRKKIRKNKKKNHEIGCPGLEPIQPQPLIENERLGQFAEGLSETFSETVSVSGIIKKYFSSDYDEVASGLGFPFTDKRLNSSSVDIMTPLQECPNVNVSREKCTKPQVGKRVLMASASLGLTLGNQKPAASLSGKSPCQKSDAIVRHLVFEISEESH